MTYRPIPPTILKRVRYDAEAQFGLVWVKPRWERWVGKATGAVIRDDSGISYLAHRIVWALHYGDPGNNQIDHADRNHSNNRIENLRLASPAQNQQNRTNFNGKSRFKGVGLHANGRWRARINGQIIGYYSTENEAAEAYNKASKQLHGDFGYQNHMD